MLMKKNENVKRKIKNEKRKTDEKRKTINEE